MKEIFFNHIKVQKRYSKHTLLAYQNDINGLEKFLETEFETTLLKATFDMMRSWVVDMVDKKLSKNSIHRKISSAKSFYKYLIKEGVLSKSPLQGLMLPKKDRDLPVFLTEKQTHQLEDDIVFPNTFTGCRDHLIMELFYQTGIRLSELVQLKTQDVNVEQGVIKVLGKRNKERIIPIHEALVVLIEAYMNEREKINVEEDASTLFLITEKGKGVYAKLVYRVVNKYIQKVSTAKKKSPHVLRHTFATHMLNNGADINAIKELLGHASLSSTQVYTHNTIEKIINIHKQAHPRA